MSDKFESESDNWGRFDRDKVRGWKDKGDALNEQVNNVDCERGGRDGRKISIVWRE